MSSRRLYPEKPLVGVGVLIENNGEYLLIQRAAEPDKGLWSVPGGMVELGERARDAAIREAYEETGLEVKPVRVLDVVDKIIHDDEGRIRFHFIIVDYLTRLVGGKLKASSDALDARWVKASQFTDFELSPTLKYLLKIIGIYPE
jgi:ADP-ribose pyrophosphatase